MATPSTRRVGYSSLVFDGRAQRYRDDKTGRFLSSQAVRAITDKDTDARSIRMNQLGQSAAAGIITPAQFRERLANDVKNVHLANAAAAKGGLHRMDQATYGLVGQQLKTHYARVDAFAQDIQNGRYKRPDGTIDSDAIQRRMDWFAQAGRGTQALVARKEHDAAGFGWMENLPDAAAKHCTGERSCTVMTGLGRVAIDDARYLPEGFRSCGASCRCLTTFYMEAQ